MTGAPELVLAALGAFPDVPDLHNAAWRVVAQLSTVSRVERA
jgi:hypothetical protein